MSDRETSPHPSPSSGAVMDLANTTQFLDHVDPFVNSAMIPPSNSVGAEWPRHLGALVEYTDPPPPMMMQLAITGTTTTLWPSPAEATPAYCVADGSSLAPHVVDREDYIVEQAVREQAAELLSPPDVLPASPIQLRPRAWAQPVASPSSELRAPGFEPLPLGVDPIPHRRSHPFNAPQNRKPITFYCVHEDGRKCSMGAPHRRKRSTYEEVSIEVF